jgi:hypothetical protein
LYHFTYRLRLLLIRRLLLALRIRQNVLVLRNELLGPLVLITVLVVRIEVFFILDNFDVGGIDFHVRRAIVEHGGWHDRHRVSQLAQLGVTVGEAAINGELAVAVYLVVLAVLRFVIAVQDTDKLLAGETLRKRLYTSDAPVLTSFMLRFSSEPWAKLHMMPS